jgi:uncharacterized membrane protein
MDLSKFGTGDRRTAVAVAIATVVAMVLRLALANYSFWYDEYASLIFADEPLSRLWSSWMVRETNPPLFYSVLRVWEAVFGQSYLTLRVLPVVAGTLGLGVIAAIAWLAYGRRAALPVVVIVGLSAGHIWTSQLLRAYIFGMDGVLISLLGLIVLIRDPSRRVSGYGLYIAGALLAIYSHTTLLLWPAVATAAFFGVHHADLRQRRWRSFVPLVGANLIVALGAAWWIAITIEQMAVSTDNIGWLKPMSFANYKQLVSHNALLLFDSGESQRWIRYSIIASMAAATLATVRNRYTLLFGLTFCLGIAAIWVVEPVHPIATEKTVRWLMIFPALIVAGGIARLGRNSVRLAAIAVIGALLTTNLVLSVGKFSLGNWKERLPTTADKNTVLLVQHESMAMVARKACAIQLATPTCPIRIVALASPYPSDKWATGMSRQPLIELRDLPRALADKPTVYTARQGQYDPLVALGHLSERQRTHWSLPNVEGPFTTEQILGHAPFAREGP